MAGTTIEGRQEDRVLAATSTLVNAGGKVLFLYCYGLKKDLEWTREASKAWASAVTTANGPPPTRSSGGSGIDWSSVARKAMIGAVVGGLLAPILVLLRRRSKKS